MCALDLDCFCVSSRRLAKERRALSRRLLALLLLIPLAFPMISTGVSSDSVAESVPISAPYTYRDFAAIREDLLSIQAQHSDIAKVYDIGDSWETRQGLGSRDILAIKISDNVSTDEDEPEVLIVGLHHAREWTTSELVTVIAENLTDGYGNDSRLSWLVDNREIWIVPVVNPDGLDYAIHHDQWWRKNRRLNYDATYGVDLNRNYNGSENGDPAGDWGGAGSSHTPSDETYCGMYPFSEPETQAIRDLVIARDFKIALDFHSYGDLVMWPWGYSSDKTPDDIHFVRIGTAMAALNGYTAEQSVGLYPTTGDSLDWEYGSQDVFAFCFEIGPDFHPTQADIVRGIISENLAPTWLGIEVAGDREERPFSIVHTVQATWNYSESGFELVADVTAARGVNASALKLVYRVDNGSWSTVPLTLAAGNDTYSATIPSQPVGSFVNYYFVARDAAGVELMSPRYAPYDLHSFEVVDLEPPIADAGQDVEVFEGSLVTFNGSGSSDNAGIDNYTWSFQYNGSSVELYGISPEFEFWTPDAYVVTLKVTDAGGLSSTDTMVVTVLPNEIPEFDGAIPVALAALSMLVIALSLYRRRRNRSVE